MKFKVKRPITYLFTVALLLCICSFVRMKDSDPDKMTNELLIKKMFAAMDNLKTLRYHLQCNERIKGKMQHTESRVKLQTSPRKLYYTLKA